MLKRTIVRKVLDWIDGWNREIHEAVELNVFAEYSRQFPNGAADSEATIKEMRTFYYSRMSSTAAILIAIIALFVSFIALLVSALALVHS